MFGKPHVLPLRSLLHVIFPMKQMTIFSLARLGDDGEDEEWKLLNPMVTEKFLNMVEIPLIAHLT